MYVSTISSAAIMAQGHGRGKGRHYGSDAFFTTCMLLRQKNLNHAPYLLVLYIMLNL